MGGALDCRHVRPIAPQESCHERARQASSAIPFDAARLDRLMDEAGIDVLIATSKHNVQYLLGGHRAFFFDYMDAMGLSRYLPVVVYPKGAPDKAAFFGHRLENFQREINPFWMPTQMCELLRLARHHAEGGRAHQEIGREGELDRRRDGVPADGRGHGAARARSRKPPSRTRCSCWSACARSRRRTSSQKLKVASEAVLDSMKAVIANHGPGATKAELTEALRREETNRGLTFEYCLITAGTSLNRAPSESGLGRGRHPLARFRRQLSRLYRRHLPHGDPRRARRRACRTCWATSRRSSAPR